MRGIAIKTLRGGRRPSHRSAYATGMQKIQDVQKDPSNSKYRGNAPGSSRRGDGAERVSVNHH